MALKDTSKPSGMLAGAVAASKPPSLADQAPEIGAHEADFRGQKDARRAAMQETNTKALIDSPAKQTTGSPPRLTTIQVDKKRQV